MLYPNLSYTVKLSGVKITADFDDSFSMQYRMDTIGYKFIEKPLHYHAMHEIFFVFDSPIEIETEKETLSLKKCMAVVPQGLYHSTTRSRDYRFLFSFEILERTHFSDFIRSLGELDYIKVFNENKEEMWYYLEELLYIFTNENEMNTEMAEAVIKLLFFHLFIYNNKNRGSISRTRSYLLRIEQIVNDNSIYYPELCSLDYLAEELSVSKKHAARITRNYFGKTFNQMVLERRLSYAASRLHKTDEPVSKISEKARFQSENYFFTQFKKTYGCTPLKYRKLIREHLDQALPSTHKSDSAAPRSTRLKKPLT